MLEGKEKFTREELDKWLVSVNRRKYCLTQPVQTIQRFLGGVRETDVRQIYWQFTYLHPWLANQYVKAALEGASISHCGVVLAANCYSNLWVADVAASMHPDDPPFLLFDDAGFMLASCIIQGWEDIGRESLGIIDRFLRNEVLNRGASGKRTPWFILELANAAFKGKTEYSEFDYPVDMGWYKPVMEQWDTQDLALVDDLATNLCEKHLLESGYDSSFQVPYEFDVPYAYLYVYEILAWLALRRMRGLENPKTFSHPMMSYTMNILPENIDPMPKLDDYIESLSKEAC